jgi:hypothetical protein
MKHPNGKRRTGDYFLGVEYDILHATIDVISVRLTFRSFTGYLNEDYSTIAINYDLTKGRDLDIADLFTPRSAYLKELAAACVELLERRDLTCSAGRSLTADGKNPEWALNEMHKGAAPDAGNYSNWNLTARGILVTFGEYQIGAGCLGQVAVVVPYERLRDVLRPSSLFDYFPLPSL